jgi:hypothetical protein
MMRVMLSALMLLVVIGCGDTGGGNNGGRTGPGGVTPGPNPQPNPTPAYDPQWGDLACQSSRSCSNPVLNLSFSEVEQFLGSQFRQKRAAADVEFDIFECGHYAEETWQATYPRKLESVQWVEVGTFLMQMVDTKTCVVKSDLDDALKTYFKQTKEYKDEVP